MSAVTEPVLPDADDRLPLSTTPRFDTARLFYGALAVIAALASGAVLLITKHGAGMIPDSAVYIGTRAESRPGTRSQTTPFNLLINPYSPAKAAAFDGAVPLTHYPPLFPSYWRSSRSSVSMPSTLRGGSTRCSWA